MLLTRGRGDLKWQTKIYKSIVVQGLTNNEIGFEIGLCSGKGKNKGKGERYWRGGGRLHLYHKRNSHYSPFTMDKTNTNKQISTLFLTNDGKFSNAGNVQDLNNIIIHIYHIYKDSTPTHLCIVFFQNTMSRLSLILICFYNCLCPKNTVSDWKTKPNCFNTCIIVNARASQRECIIEK